MKPLPLDAESASEEHRTPYPSDRTLASPGQGMGTEPLSDRDGPGSASSQELPPNHAEQEGVFLAPVSLDSWMADAPTVPHLGAEARVLGTGEELGHFRIVSKLGEGGMGVVYHAVDLESGQAVALKTLQRMDHGGLTRLKNEFRAVADVVHPNLVSIGELFCVDGEWFFTMELIEGVSFLSYVRGAYARDNALKHVDPALLRRLRPALRQLAAGVDALHIAGKLHRDLKPGNVMVTRAGRVVILDFGLSRSATLETIDPREERAGTPAYMAPEQAWGRLLSAAVDWYSVGAMLFQALTGQLPFEGSAAHIIKAKRRITPPPPSAIASGVPPDLDELCAQLLRTQPEERPSGAEVLARLAKITDEGERASRSSGPAPMSVDPCSGLRLHGPRSSSSEPASADPHPPPSGPESGDPENGSSRGLSGALSPFAQAELFMGREAQLLALEEAYREAAAGKVAVVYVHGRSGMGKSALVRRFLDGLRQRAAGLRAVHHVQRSAGQTGGALGPGAVILEGRCYERERVPYKAFDSLVDALARYLRKLPQERALDLLPLDMHELATMFPVLRAIDPSFVLVSQREGGPDAQVLRRRAFRAFKALLGRLGVGQPLVLWIDDLQWGDRDSALLLSEIVAPPDPPALLLVGTYRSEEAATSPLLRELFEQKPDTDRTHVRQLEVRPLSREEAMRLALARMGQDDEDARARAEQIARESGGNPLFVEQLVEHAVALGDGRAGEAPAEGARSHSSG